MLASVFSKVIFENDKCRGLVGEMRGLLGCEKAPNAGSCSETGFLSDGPIRFDTSNLTSIGVDPVLSVAVRVKACEPKASGPGVPYNVRLELSRCSHPGASDNEYVKSVPEDSNVESAKTKEKVWEMRATGGN